MTTARVVAAGKFRHKPFIANVREQSTPSASRSVTVSGMTCTTPADRDVHWFDVNAGAVRLAISRRTVRRLAQRRLLTHFRVGSQLRFTDQDIDRYLMKGRVSAST